MKTSAMISNDSETCNLHESERSLLAESASREKFEAILGFACGEAQGLELHEIERGLLQRLLELGYSLLNLAILEKGSGKEETGSQVTSPTGELLPYHSIKTRKSYLSIFGELSIDRAYYWKSGAVKGYFPLDADLNLPEKRYSYLLQEWGELLGADGSFEQVTERIEGILGVKFWTQGVQSDARVASADVQGFYEQAEIPAANTEGAILVATLDGKRVPLRPVKPRGVKLRLGKGEKPCKKKEAVVSAVYTIDAFPRTAEDVIRKIDNDNCTVNPDLPPKTRPVPQTSGYAQHSAAKTRLSPRLIDNLLKEIQAD